MIFLIYLVSVVDSVIKLAEILAFLTCVGGAFCVFLGINEDEPNLRKVGKTTLFKIAFPLMLVATFTPSSKTIAAMWLVPKIVANQTLQGIPDKMLEVLDGKLDKWLQGLVEEEKK